MTTRKKTTKRYPRLTDRERTLTAKYIAEEIATRKYSPAQAKAIGISRARAKMKNERQRKR